MKLKEKLVSKIYNAFQIIFFQSDIRTDMFIRHKYDYIQHLSEEEN
jgi:hypothetical protein